MKKSFILAVLLVAVFFMQFVSAEILIGQTAYTYSVGDRLNLEITLKPEIPVNDFLIINLFCADQNAQLYKNPFNLEAFEEKIVNVDIVLDKSVIDSLIGNSCYLKVDYGSDSANSQAFDISGDIEVSLDLEVSKFSPGDSVYVNGNAFKSNGERVNGFVEVSIDVAGVTLSKTVHDGSFSFNFSLPEDALPGQHPMEIKVYEKDISGEISNEGKISESIEIMQVFNDLEIEVNSQTVKSGDEFTYIIRAYDQSHRIIKKEIGLTIYGPEGDVFDKKLVNSNEEQLMVIGPDQAPGYWKLEAISGDHKSRKLFYVEENRDAMFSVVENTLIITNIGNAVYEKVLEINIGSAKEIKHVNLEVGETKRFKLEAPDGDYEINVNDGDKREALGMAKLTGRAIGVGEIKEGLIGDLTNPFIWIIFGLVVVLVVASVILRRLKKRMNVNVPGKIMLNPRIKSVKPMQPNPQETTQQNVALNKPVQKPKIPAKIPQPKAQDNSLVVVGGKREDASAVVIQIDEEKSPSNYSQFIDPALIIAKNAGARIYVDRNFRIILFSPLLTKTNDNELLSISTAKKMKEKIDEHNRKTKKKIHYGIAVNDGVIISELQGEHFKFTSLGSIITAAKKLANSSKEDLLISESIRKKVLNEVKTDQSMGGLWRVTGVVGRK